VENIPLSLYTNWLNTACPSNNNVWLLRKNMLYIHVSVVTDHQQAMYA